MRTYLRVASIAPICVSCVLPVISAQSSLPATSSGAAPTGKVLHVDAAGKAEGAEGSAAKPFITIADAIVAAEEGDTVKIAKGAYAEKLALGRKNLSLVGGFAGGGDFAKPDPAANLTVIQGDGKSSVLTLRSADGARVSGLKITGGAHGIEVAGGMDITISNNIIADNNGPTGGGIYFYDVRNLTIADNHIMNNKARDDGGGIGFRRGRKVENLLISGNHVESNSVDGEHGGGMFVEGTGTIANNLVENNSSAFGSGIFINGGVYTVTGNTVRNNKSHGIFMIDYSHRGDQLVHTLDHNLIYGNKVGLGTFWASFRLVSCTIADNPGGAMEKRDDPKLKIDARNTIFWNNAPDPKSMTFSYCLAAKDLPGEGNLKGDPLFAGTKDAPDYHLKSAAGRWDPKAKDDTGHWVNDDATSPAISAGDPKADASRQPKSAAGRIEIGAYGNTPEASK